MPFIKHSFSINIAIRIQCLLLLFFLFSFKHNIAQPFLRFDYLPVSNNSVPLRYPWTGGINSAQFGKADVNNDGKKDLIVYDKSNQKYCVFITQATNSTAYKFEHKYAAYLPPINGWMIVKDYNCDGIDDIFTYNGIANIKVYTGFYVNDTLHYKLQQDGFYYQGTSSSINVYCADVLKPAIADINKDGDLDIVSFNVFGNRLIYYENQQKELSLPCDSLFFIKADNCWGNVFDSFAASYALRDTCNFKFNRLNGTEEILHTGSTIESADVDNNGAMDMLIGSVSLNNLTMLQNNGTSSYASILNQDIAFPSYDSSFNTNSFGSPHFLDIDNDSKNDLLVSTFDPGAANVNNIWYYKNVQANGTRLNLIQKNFLLDNMIDAGENSNPCFFDVDGDGLKDILLGSGGFRDNVTTTYKLQFYKNTGTLSSPAFDLQNDDYLNISTFNVKDIVPAVGDLDNDSDTDLVIGIADGRIIYWENTASSGNPPVFLYRGLLKDSLNNNISVGSSAAPYLIDINRDGKTDLIVGERNGNLNFYKGNSTNTTKFSFVTDSLGAVRIKTNGFSIGYTHPSVADVNNDGKYDLVLGTNTSGLQLYSNIEDQLNGVFALTSPVVTDYLGFRTTAAIADITNDGNPELLTGNIDGGLIIFSKVPPPIIPSFIKNYNSASLLFDIFPNPANNQLYIDLKSVKNNIQLQVFNLVGQEIFSENFNLKDVLEINTDTFANGMYLVKIADGEKEGVQKLVIQH